MLIYFKEIPGLQYGLMTLQSDLEHGLQRRQDEEPLTTIMKFGAFVCYLLSSRIERGFKCLRISPPIRPGPP
ncbi:hypothetical protein AgCh_034896 [Apium graveolens]